jgi:peptidoglycan/LPS O-acetylase OafA/YrhL
MSSISVYELVLDRGPGTAGVEAVGPPAKVPTRKASRVEKASRIESIDAARFIAVAGVLAVHASQIPEIAFAVPFYVFASLYFQARSFRRKPKPLHLYIPGRLRRLYLPFLVWTCIYAVTTAFRNYMHGQPFALRFHWEWLLVGSMFHLWFLPFLMVVTIIGAMGCRVAAKYLLIRRVIVVVSALIGAFLAIAPRPDWLNYSASVSGGFFYLSAWKALPSFFLGWALAWWLAEKDEEPGFTPAIGFIGIILTATMIGDQLINGYSRLHRNIAGLGLLMAGLVPWRGRFVAALASMGRLSYGVYLSHVMVASGLKYLTTPWNLPNTASRNFFFWAATLAGSYLLALTFDRIKWLRFLNG